jgi:crotonobetainyl-CoA:carnitine CoA-transferase CaiB-like acyl-CoA transferase
VKSAPSSEFSPLSGIVVAEIGERIAVGVCGSLLAQLGATVIVEEPAAAHRRGKWRQRASAMAGKRSVTFGDVPGPRGVPDAAGDGRPSSSPPFDRDALLDGVDIVLLSSDDGSGSSTWVRHYADTTIVVDITAFGHGSPWEGRGGSEEAVQALTGIVATTGPIDRPPVAVGVPVLETKSAVYAAASALLALRVRRLHGIGQRIDVALADVAINSLANFLALHFGGLPAVRSGNRHPLYVPWGSYRARDGFLLACSVTDEQFLRVCSAIGAPDLATDPRFATTIGRLAHFVELDRRIGEWSAGRTVADCEAALLGAGVASGRIVTLSELEQEPNLVHRRSMRRVFDAHRERYVTLAASPIRAQPMAVANALRIPRRGEDNAEAQRWLRPRTAAARPAHGRQLPPPLEGVRVVEIGHYTVAPLASRILGAFGADVVKIEAPQGDAVRHGPPLRADGQAYIFALSNTDKRGLVLNLRETAHRETLHRLLEQADILVENMRPGALARLGLGSEALRARHPRLVYCSITGFGTDSVYDGRAALDTVIQAMSGMMSLTLVDGEPTKTGISTSDNLGGLVGMLACLAGLELRDRTGVATHFDISMQDVSAWATHSTRPDAAETPPAVLRARDGFVLAHGPASTLAADDAAQMSRDALAALVQKSGHEAVPVLDVAEVLAHPNTVARKLLVTRPTSDGSDWTVLNSPMRLQATPPRVRSVMPRLGAENPAILAEFGLTQHPPIRSQHSS